MVDETDVDEDDDEDFAVWSSFEEAFFDEFFFFGGLEVGLAMDSAVGKRSSNTNGLLVYEVDDAEEEDDAFFNMFAETLAFDFTLSAVG